MNEFVTLECVAALFSEVECKSTMSSEVIRTLIELKPSESSLDDIIGLRKLFEDVLIAQRYQIHSTDFTCNYDLLNEFFNRFDYEELNILFTNYIENELTTFKSLGDYVFIQNVVSLQYLLEIQANKLELSYKEQVRIERLLNKTVEIVEELDELLKSSAKDFSLDKLLIVKR